MTQSYNITLHSDMSLTGVVPEVELQPGNTTNYSLVDSIHSQDAHSTSLLDNLMIILYLYGIPILVGVGLITNTLSFLVFTTSKLRHHSSSVYLASMAISDTGFLLTLFIGWLGWVNIHLFHRAVWCQLVIYLAYVCSFLSAWNVASFTVERYIAVVYPFQRISMCTVRRAVLVVVGEAIFASLLYSFSLWSSHITYRGTQSVCATREIAQRLVEVMMHIDSIITLVLPSVVIVTLNIRIAVTLYYFNKKRENLSETISLDRQRANNHSIVTARSSNNGTSFASEMTEYRPHQTIVRTQSDTSRNLTGNTNSVVVSGTAHVNKVHVRVTSMLLVVSTVFVSLNLPIHAFRLYNFVMGSHNKAVSVNKRAWQELLMFFSYLNFAINFFLYVGLRKAFRVEIANLFIRAKHRMLLMYYRSICFAKCCAPSDREGGGVRTFWRQRNSNSYSSHTRRSFI